MPIVESPKRQRLKVDPHLESAAERVKAAAAELERLGAAGKDGMRIRTDLPEDVREGAITTSAVNDARDVHRRGPPG